MDGAHCGQQDYNLILMKLQFIECNTLKTYPDRPLPTHMGMATYMTVFLKKQLFCVTRNQALPVLSISQTIQPNLTKLKQTFKIYQINQVGSIKQTSLSNFSTTSLNSPLTPFSVLKKDLVKLHA